MGRKLGSEYGLQNIPLDLLRIHLKVKSFPNEKSSGNDPLGKRISSGLGNLSTEGFLVWKAFLIIPAMVIPTFS